MFPPAAHEGSLPSTASPTLVSCLFERGHSDGCEVMAQCGFDGKGLVGGSVIWVEDNRLPAGTLRDLFLTLCAFPVSWILCL